MRINFCQLDSFKGTLVSRWWGFHPGLAWLGSIVDRDPPAARVPNSWLLVGPSLVGTAVETIGPAIGLLGPDGPEKKLFDPYPLCETSPVRLGRLTVQHDFGGKG